MCSELIEAHSPERSIISPHFYHHLGVLQQINASIGGKPTTRSVYNKRFTYRNPTCEEMIIGGQTPCDGSVIYLFLRLVNISYGQ